MTVPAIATWDDWAFDLCDSTGAPIYYLNADIRDFEGVAIPGATAHRLEGCSFRMSGECGAAAHIDPTVIQFIRITPYGDPTHSLWGIIGKPKQEYGPRGEASVISVSCVGVEYLLHSREVYHYDGADIGWITVTGGVDDFLKEMVRQTAVAATCGTDIDGASRAWTWGTLAVAADTTAGPVDTYSEGEGWLDEVIASYAKKHGVGWELRPTISGGAVTFTFATAVPNNGTDKSTGTSRVIINDFAQTLIPAGARWRDWQGLITDMHGRGYATVVGNSTLRTAWGRWEGHCNETIENQVALQLAQFGLKEGAEFTFEASAATGGACRWMAEYEAGDIVLRNNTRLGIASSAETIAGIKFTFPNRVLKLEIRWGEKEPTQQQKQNGKYHRIAPDIPVFPRYATPVAVGATNAIGTVTANNMVTGDHVHKGVIAVGAQTVSPDAGVTTFVAGTGIVLTGNSPAAHQITFASSVTGGCHWDRDANGGDPYLFQRTLGDDVFLLADGAAVEAPQFKIMWQGGNETFHINGEGNIHGAKSDAGAGQSWVGTFGDAAGYRDLIMHGHDLGVHDIEISGGIVSIPGGTASKIVWLGGSDAEDAVWVHQITGYVENGSGARGDTEPATKRWLLNNTGVTLYNGAGNVVVGQWDRNTNFFKMWVTAGTSESFHIDARGNIHGGLNDAGAGQAWVGTYGDAHGYRDLLMHGHDLGIHDVEISGNIVSIPTTTGSKLVWLGGSDTEDVIWAHQVLGYVENSDGSSAPATRRWALNNTGLVLYGAGNVVLGQWDRADGNLSVIKGLAYAWPAAHSAGVLTNNGSGTLSWGAAASCVWTDDGTYVYPTNAGRNLRIRDSGGTAIVSISGSTGNGVFAGTLQSTTGTLYLGDGNTYLQRMGGSSLTRLSTDMGSIYLTHATNTLLFYNGAFAPLTSFKLGDTSYRWSNVYSVLGSFSGQISSSLATGTAPFAPTSTTVCTNLNTDMLDGFHASEASDVNKIPVRDASQYIYASGFVLSVNYYLKPGETGTALAIAGDISMTGKSVYGTALVNGAYHVTPAGATSAAFAGTVSATRYTSTIATGTAPFTVASQTEVTNLNAYLLNGHSSATAATGNTICLRGASGEGTFAALGATTGTFSSSVSCTALGATTGTFSSSVSCTALTASTGNVTVTAGNVVLSTAGATVDGVDLSAFYTSYLAHRHSVTAAGTIGAATITLSGKTETYSFEGSPDWAGTNLRDSAGNQLYMDGTGHLTYTAAGNTVIGTGTRQHTHLLTGGTYGTGAASQATHAFTGSAVNSGTPS